MQTQQKHMIVSGAKFKALEYIESTGTQYIDTGIVLAGNEIVECTFQYTSLTPPDGIAQQNGIDVSGKGICIWSVQGGGICIGMYPTWTGIIEDEPLLAHTIVFDFVSRNVSVDGHHRGNGGVVGQSQENSVYLFARNEKGTPQHFCAEKIFSMIITREGKEIMKLIPVEDQKGRVCMYDAVSNMLLHNAGTGEFIKGPYLQRNI